MFWIILSGIFTAGAFALAGWLCKQFTIEPGMRILIGFTIGIFTMLILFAGMWTSDIIRPGNNYYLQ